MLRLLQCIAVLGLTCISTGCLLSETEDEGLLKRVVTARELHGTWMVVDEKSDLSELSRANGLGPLSLTGKAIVLNSDGTCTVGVTSPQTTSDEDDATETGDGLARHPTDVCLWEIGRATATKGWREEDIAAVHVTITRAGYLRGLSFLVSQQNGAVRLLVRRDAANAADYLELRR